MTSLRNLMLAAATLAVLFFAAPLPCPACPFCSQEKGPTLLGDFSTAQMVLVGTFANAKLGGKGALEDGTTDLVLDKVLKSHEILKTKATTVNGKQVITLPRYLPQAKNQFLIFCDVYKGAIDPYRGVELQSANAMVDYLQGAIKLKDRPAGERLAFCFNFLQSPDFEVAMDAYREYAKADYKDYMEVAKKYPADTIAKWLQDPKTPPFRYGLYSSLLGHCGTTEHAKLLRKMIDDPEKRKGSGIDGMLAAYVMLQPMDAYGYLCDILKDSSQEFLMRYAALRTIRFLWDQRPDLVAKKDLVSATSLILDHGDMADFAIEDLRKWQRWELADRILDLFGKKSHDIGVVKRAILRFALKCPNARAVTFVQDQRRRDGEWVRDTEELLRLEYPDEAKK